MPCVVMKTAFTFLFIAGLCEGDTVLLREHFYMGETLDWNAAQNRCRTWLKDLSSVLTEEDAERVMSARPGGFTGKAWIGLSGTGTWSALLSSWTYTWLWSSGETMGFTKWAAGQPSSGTAGSRACVSMQNDYWLKENDCTVKIPSYCFQAYNRKLTVVQEAMAWENALVYCRSKYTDLSSLLSNYTAEKVISSTRATTDFVWTGLRFLTGGWYWVNGDPMLYSVWPNSEQFQCPDMPLRCGALSVKEKVFVARPCDEELDFICYTQLRWYTDLSSVLTEEDAERVMSARPSGSTDPAWIGLYRVSSSCFIVASLSEAIKTMAWENALVYCRSKFTDLSSLLSNYTAEKVISSTGATTDFVWTGLRFLMGGWFWVNGDPMRYSAWSNDEQSKCPDMPLRCGALSVKEKVFVARRCDEELNFICYSQL
ncbi:secretory phospholipase A2 receptor-like [Anguilla rostrata]|uniref:secretory phospholipase A2 receptor-like n=1 Tax=Anguilla rostrata TaxID=7938 RepID=UPI0030CCDABC